VGKLFRKCGRQAERQKTITGVRTGAEKDGSRVLKASDGDMIGLDDPKSTQEYKYGGVDPQTLAFLIQTKDLASYMWGNLDALGGLSPQADTLGQDQLLTANASKRIEDMQDRTVEFVKDVTTDLAWYLFTDPLIEMPLVKRVPGTDIEIPTAFRAEDREGDFLDYNFDIEPYSMQHQSPGMRIQTLMEIFERLLAPAMPMLEAQGITINFEAFLQTISKYRNMPELQDILVFSGPPQSYGEGPVGQPPKQSPVTTRRYERVNRPGATRSGKDHVLMQALLGQASQPAEAATLTRAVG
jgi:hypothetical protein